MGKLAVNGGRKVRDEVGPLVTAVKQLRGFRKIALESGERKAIGLTLSPKNLSLLDKELKQIVDPGRFEITVGASSEEIRPQSGFSVSDQ